MMAGMHTFGRNNRDCRSNKTSDGPDIGLVYETQDDVGLQRYDISAHLNQMIQGQSDRVKP